MTTSTISKTLEEKVVSMENRILVTGAAGAIGRRLVPELREQYGTDLVVAGYNRTPLTGLLASGPMERVNVVDKDALRATIERHDIGTVYHLAAMLSIAAEKNPELAKEVNEKGFTNVLELAGEYKLRLFWPSSIAVFGPAAPKDNTPQDAPLDPTTNYGKAKVLSEQQGETYFNEQGVDFRSVRLPGVNDRLEEGEKPGPGTTEYVMDMVYAAKKNKPYVSPLRPDTMLPMMDMRDVIGAIKQIMAVPKEQINIHTSYNLDGMSFTPEQLEKSIRELINSPNFKVSYEIDSLKQPIADSWPDSIDDSAARKDWDWKPKYDLTKMVKYMLS